MDEKKVLQILMFYGVLFSGIQGFSVHSVPHGWGSCISRRICWLVSVSYFGSDLSPGVGSV